MKITSLLILTVAMATNARADFSYTMTTKVTGGMMASMMGSGQDRLAHYYLKGKKVKVDSGDLVMILDYEAQTTTTISNSRKTVTVHSMTELPAGTKGADIHVDVKETGQKKLVNGFNTSEILLSIDTTMDAPGGRGPMKVQAEMSMWLASDVPGAGELRSLTEKNGAMSPFTAAAGNSNAGLQSAIAEMQKKMGSFQGFPVQQIIRMKSPAGGAGMPQVSSDQAGKMQDSLAKARAQLEAMAKQGGPGAAIAQQQLARLPGGTPAASAGSSGSLIEMTVDSSGFSTAAIPDATFTIPADYQVVK